MGKKILEDEGRGNEVRRGEEGCERFFIRFLNTGCSGERTPLAELFQAWVGRAEVVVVRAPRRGGQQLRGAPIPGGAAGRVCLSLSISHSELRERGEETEDTGGYAKRASRCQGD